MERDDGSVPRIFLYIIKDIIGCEVARVVACDQVPHDDGVVATDVDVLLVPHPSAWWAEKIGMNKRVSFVGIAQEAAARHHESAQMVEGVVAQSMSVRTYQFEEVGIFPHVVTHHEECGFHAVVVKGLDEPRRRFGDGTIVESQIDRFLRRIHSPDSAGVEPAQPFGGLFDDHLVIYNVPCTMYNYHCVIEPFAMRLVVSMSQ